MWESVFNRGFYFGRSLVKRGHKVVIKEGFPCRPCYDYCRYKEPYCLTEIRVDDVTKAVDEKLSKI